MLCVGILIYSLLALPCQMAETDCKLTHRGIEYRGTRSQTASGRTCQRWDAQSPHVPHWRPPGDIKQNKNYCRNPVEDNNADGPWCYTTDPNRRWETCGLPLCSNPQPVGSWIFDLVYGGLDTSVLGENSVTMMNNTYGPGLDGQANGAVLTPESHAESMIIYNPNNILRFNRAVSFITYVYTTGNIGCIFEYHENAEGAGLRLWVYPTPADLHFGSAPVMNVFNILNEYGWQKIALTFGTSVKVYVNDSMVYHSDNAFDTSSTAKRDIYFGTRPGSDIFMHGRVACAKFYDLELNEEELKTIECRNKACGELSNGRCTGSCIGFYVGEACDTYIVPLVLPKSQIETEVLSQSTVSVSWRVLGRINKGTGNFYRFIVRHKYKDSVEFQESDQIQGEVDDDHIYSHLIQGLQRAEYEISIRSSRAIGSLIEYSDSELITIRRNCEAPDTPQGLSVYWQNDTFIVTWASNLETLDSGCITNQVVLLYKNSVSGIWATFGIDVHMTNFAIPANGNEECYIQMVTINNAGMEASTDIVSFPSDWSKTMSSYFPEEEFNTDITSTLQDGSTNNPSATGETFQSNDQQNGMFDGQHGKVLIIGISLIVMAILMMITTAIAAVVCWQKAKQLRNRSNHGEDKLDGKTNPMHISGVSHHYECNYIEPTAHSELKDETYQEIGDRPQMTTEDGQRNQYESLKGAHSEAP